MNGFDVTFRDDQDWVDFGRSYVNSEAFKALFRDGMTLVEETAAYLDGEGRRESKLLSRQTALAYAAESMGLTTRLMQVASWLLVQRAVREGDMTPETAAQPRYRLAARKPVEQPSSLELPIALVEFMVRADKLHDRIAWLDQRIYSGEAEVAPANPVLSQHDRLQAAFGRG